MKPFFSTLGLRSHHLLLLLFLLVAPATVQARSADDSYHAAASLYVAGKIQDASVEAEDGLRQHPGDLKLTALAEQLRKLKDQQRGNSGQGGDKDKKKDQKKNPDDAQNKDQDKNRPKDGDREKDRQDESQKPEDKPSDPKSEDGKNAAPQPQKMSEADAKRLLNSFADDEKKEQAERRKAIRGSDGTEQDW